NINLSCFPIQFNNQIKLIFYVLFFSINKYYNNIIHIFNLYNFKNNSLKDLYLNGYIIPLFIAFLQYNIHIIKLFQINHKQTIIYSNYSNYSNNNSSSSSSSSSDSHIIIDNTFININKIENIFF